MIKLNTFILITLFMLISSLVSGCGQKGALHHAQINSLEIDQAYKKQDSKTPEIANPKALKQEPSAEKETHQ